MESGNSVGSVNPIVPISEIELRIVQIRDINLIVLLNHRKRAHEAKALNTAL